MTYKLLYLVNKKLKGNITMNLFKNYKSALLRVIAMIIPIIVIMVLENYKDKNYDFISILIGMGAFLPSILACDYYKEYNLAYRQEKLYLNQEINDDKTFNLFKNYIQNTFLHVICVLPIVLIIIGPNNIIGIISTLTYISGEKIFDESQRFLQCAEADINKYSIYLILRKCFLFLPVLLIFLKINSSIIILLISIMSIISNLLSWSAISGYQKTIERTKIIIKTMKIKINKLFTFIMLGYPLKQIIISFIFSSINILPYIIISSMDLDNRNISTFVLYQKLLFIPMIIYSITFYAQNRAKIISPLKIDKKIKNRVFLNSIAISLIIITISLLLNNFYKATIYLPLLLLQAISSIILLGPLDYAMWNISINKKIKTFLPVIILYLLIMFLKTSYFSKLIIYSFIIILLFIPSIKLFYYQPYITRK